MKVLLDSDILIEILRGRNPSISAQWSEFGKSEDVVLYSPVSSAEVWAGARPNDHASIENLLGAMRCVPIDKDTGRWAGDYLRQYNKSHGLHIADALIAATALQTGASLWTRNRKHFPMKELSFF